MEAYIIHFDDKPWEDLDDEQYYRCKEIPWFSTTKTTISRLTPYTEDSAYAHGYTEAESKYREIRDELEKQAYQRGYETAKHEYEDCTKPLDNGKAYQQGLTDAWEAARTLWNTAKRKEIFGYTVFSTALMTLTGQEAIEKIRQYEQEKEEQIQVGDEVIATSGKAVIVGINADKDKARYIYPDSTLGFDNICNLSKTGRHFPEIAEVLAKMKESDNG